MSLAVNFLEDQCVICKDATGFSTLCNSGENRDHNLCLECAVTVYRITEDNVLSCGLCREKFNFQDYLVVRELHLIQSQSEESILAYTHMMGNYFFQGSPVEKFLLLGEESQREMISQMYWGNDRLFDGVYDLLFDEGDDYSTNIAQNKRIKRNLLEILGDPWSLDEAEKNRKLTEVFTNGWLVKFCQNELKETFLHRCHLFLRANLPLHQAFNKYLLFRMQNVAKFFPEYIPIFVNVEYVDRCRVVARPAIGPLDVEESKSKLCGQTLFSTVNWGLLNRVQILNSGDLEDNLVDLCAICHNNQGFPILCKEEDYAGEHKFCLDCIVNLQLTTDRHFCPICNTQFNFNDYLVVRELHLIHSLPEQSVFNYFHKMMKVVPMPNSNELLFKNFLWLCKKEQQDMLSEMYWGDRSLFRNINRLGNCYNPTKAVQNQRIVENLLEVFGDLWSPQLGRKEKDRKLLEFFTNGLLVKPCQNESKETFLHRCNLFLRSFVPKYINKNVTGRMREVLEFFPEYYRVQYRVIERGEPYVNRPAIGPTKVESFTGMEESVRSVKWLRSKYGSLTFVSDLKKLMKSLCVLNMGMFCFPALIYAVGLGFNVVIIAALTHFVALAIFIIVSFIYCKYFAYDIHCKITFLHSMPLYNAATTLVVTIGISLFLLL